MTALPMAILTREGALIFRITHIENVPWILDNGLCCGNSATRDPAFRAIGNLDLIGRRAHRTIQVSPGGTLSDYIPFYFTPLSPMLYNIRTGWNGIPQLPMSDIVIVVSSVRRLEELGIAFVLSDRHAYLDAAELSNDVGGLERVDWKILQGRDFKRSLADPGKVERYQAEALVHRHLPLTAILEIACYSQVERSRLQNELTARNLSLKLTVRSEWYF